MPIVSEAQELSGNPDVTDNNGAAAETGALPVAVDASMTMGSVDSEAIQNLNESVATGKVSEFIRTQTHTVNPKLK